MLIARDDEALERAGPMRLDRRSHGRRRLARADDDGASFGRRDLLEEGRQTDRRMRRADSGVEHGAEELAVVFGHYL